MSASRTTVALLTAGLLFCGWTGPRATAQEPQPALKLKQAAKRTPMPPAAQAPPVVQPQPVPEAGPLPPLTLAESPALPPKVSYGDGLLTIVAQNSTLGDVLRAVRAQTGATLDVPSNATERMVAHLGPGPAREVLAALLNGSHFNYVILGSATNPAAIQQVILTSKSGGEAAPAAVSNRRRAAPGEGEEGEESAAEEPPADDSSNDADNQDQSQPEEAPAQQPGAPAAVKSPEELLKELQMQQQVQQQLQQQQQGGAQPQNPPPQ